MGRLFSQEWESRTAVRDHLIEQLTFDGRRVLDHASTGFGRRMWAVVEIPSGERFVFLALIEGDRRHGFGYKDMDESMGPVEVDCPLRFLDMVPEPGDTYAREWRKRVRAHHAKAAESWAPGDRCKVHLHTYTVIGKHKRSYIIEDESGRRWRASPLYMKPVEVGA